MPSMMQGQGMPMQGADKNVGDSRSKYPDANTIPGVMDNPGGQAAAGGDVKSNPVMNALDTITQFVLSKVKQGLPNAEEMKTKFTDFLQSLMGGAPGNGQPSPAGAAGQGKMLFNPFEAPPEAGELVRPNKGQGQNLNQSIQPLV